MWLMLCCCRDLPKAIGHCAAVCVRQPSTSATIFSLIKNNKTFRPFRLRPHSTAIGPTKQKTKRNKSNQWKFMVISFGRRFLLYSRSTLVESNRIGCRPASAQPEFCQRIYSYNLWLWLLQLQPFVSVFLISKIFNFFSFCFSVDSHFDCRLPPI